MRKRNYKYKNTGYLPHLCSTPSHSGSSTRLPHQRQHHYQWLRIGPNHFLILAMFASAPQYHVSSAMVINVSLSDWVYDKWLHDIISTLHSWVMGTLMVVLLTRNILHKKMHCFHSDFNLKMIHSRYLQKLEMEVECNLLQYLGQISIVIVNSFFNDFCNVIIDLCVTHTAKIRSNRTITK